MTLSSRISSLTGPDRAVDAEVARAIHGYRADGSVPEFTASLDAAMSAVPEGWRCGFEQAGRFDGSDVVEAWCWPFESSFEPDWRNGDEGYRGAPDACRATAPTPALALLAAALEARGL